MLDEHLNDFAVAGKALRYDLGQGHQAGSKDDGQVLRCHAIVGGMLGNGQKELHEERERVEAECGKEEDTKEQCVDFAVAAKEAAEHGLLDVARCENWLGELSEKELEDIGHVDDVMGFAETSAAFEVGLKRINAIIETFKDIAYIRRLIMWAVVSRFKLLYVFFVFNLYCTNNTTPTTQFKQLYSINLITKC